VTNCCTAGHLNGVDAQEFYLATEYDRHLLRDVEPAFGEHPGLGDLAYCGVHAGERVNLKQAKNASWVGRSVLAAFRDSRGETQGARGQHAFGLSILAMPRLNGLSQLRLLLR